MDVSFSLATMVKDYVLMLAGGTHGIYLLEDLSALPPCTNPAAVY